MKFAARISLAVSLFLVSGCGISIHSEFPNSKPASAPRQLTSVGTVRYSTKSLASGARFTSGSGRGQLIVTFSLPGQPLPKTLEINYTPGSSSYSYSSTVHPLVCTKTAEDLTAGTREFTCTMARISDNDIYYTYYMQSLKFTLDGVPGTFQFESTCGIICNSSTADVYLDQTYLPSLDAADSSASK